MSGQKNHAYAHHYILCIIHTSLAVRVSKIGLNTLLAQPVSIV